MTIEKNEVENTISKYRKLYTKFGYSPKSLGWDKGRQDIRFESLLSFFDCRNKSILDIGCGFGDLNRILQKLYGSEYSYVGLDLVDEFIKEARLRYHGGNIEFILADYLGYNFTERYDIIIGSGIFNNKFVCESNDAFIENVMSKSKFLCNEGFAFDFLSDKVEFKYDHTYHSSPEKVLSIAYSLSRNIVLRNDCLPFEFSLCVYKDDSYEKSDAVFNRYKKVQGLNV